MPALRHEEFVLPGDQVYPEGITEGPGTTFYVGSIDTGTIYRGDLDHGRQRRALGEIDHGGSKNEPFASAPSRAGWPPGTCSCTRSTAAR